MPWLAGVQLAAALAGMLLLLAAPGRAAPLLSPAAGRTALPAAYLGQRQAALELSRHGSPPARTSPGSGLWLSLALCLLLASEAIRHLPSGRSAALAAQCASLAVAHHPARYRGARSASLLKEYANRQEVFDDALRQHLLLLFGTLPPGLLIGLPLGYGCGGVRRWQAPAFTALNDPDYSVGSAFWPADCAACRSGALFPTLGELGVSGTGVAPALIASPPLLPPLVRGVDRPAAGAQDALKARRRWAWSAGQRCQCSFRWRCRYCCAACRVVSAKRRHGGSGRADRRRRLGALVFRAGQQRWIWCCWAWCRPFALAVVDALFALWAPRLKRGQ